MDLAIETINLSKRFGDTIALNDVNLKVGRGEVFGLLGPNGAGKTTLFNVLSTLLLPDGGRAFVDGFDVVKDAEKVRERIAIVSQFAGMDMLLTGWDNLEFFAKIYRIPSNERRERIKQALEALQLHDVARDKPVFQYSGGMKRRLALARALIRRPEVLLMDEPTAGLDPIGKRSFWEIVKELNEQHGTTVFVTTHDMEEADKYCERLAIIDKGRLVVEGSPEALKGLIKGGEVIEVGFEASVGHIFEGMERIPGVLNVRSISPSGKLKRPKVYVFAGEVPEEYRREAEKDKDAMIITIPVEKAMSMSKEELEAYVKEMVKEATKCHSVGAPTELVRIYGNNSEFILPKLFELLAVKGIKVNSVLVKKPSLEDVFIYHVGRKFD